jgi:hypothetical protein
MVCTPYHKRKCIGSHRIAVYLEELDSVPHSDPAEDEFEDAYADEDVVAV